MLPFFYLLFSDDSLCNLANLQGMNHLLACFSSCSCILVILVSSFSLLILSRKRSVMIGKAKGVGFSGYVMITSCFSILLIASPNLDCSSCMVNTSSNACCTSKLSGSYLRKTSNINCDEACRCQLLINLPGYP